MNAVEYAAGIRGWMREVELEWLARTAAALQAGAVWVEVGTWMGRSWSAVALSLPRKATIVSVDTFDGGTYDAGTVKFVREHGSVLGDFRRVYDDIRRMRPDLLTRIIARPSVEAAPEVLDRTCDVVFVDGDHSTVAVRTDIAAWIPKLKPRGLLCGHDVDDPNVMAALDGLPLERMDQSVRGSIWCRKRTW